MILFRILQALGAATLQTNSFAIITAAFPERERGKGLGTISTVAGIGITAGPAIGGLIADALDWRGIFFLNVPVGLIGKVMAYLILGEEIASRTKNIKTTGHSLERDTILMDGGDAMATFGQGIEKAFLAGSLLCILGIVFSMGKVQTARDRGIHGRANAPV